MADSTSAVQPGWRLIGAGSPVGAASIFICPPNRYNISCERQAARLRVIRLYSTLGG